MKPVLHALTALAFLLAVMLCWSQDSQSTSNSDTQTTTAPGTAGSTTTSTGQSTDKPDKAITGNSRQGNPDEDLHRC